MSFAGKASHTFRLGELFCGAGGLSYGILGSRSDDNRLDVQHEWATDIDSDSCNTYINNICPNNPESVICDDVKDLDFNSMNSIDAFAYGFPCNSFSNIGKHKGISNEKFGMLYWHGVEVLRKFQPKWFIAENVSGIKSSGDKDFKNILKDLKDSGYALSVHNYWAELYGVPQKRHRIFVVGIRDDLNLKFEIPAPNIINDYDISSGKAIADIPENTSHHQIHKISSKIKERLSYIEPGQNVWEAMHKMPEHLRIKSSTHLSQIYRKLDPSKPSYTLTASGGGGTFGYHWENRELTNRERARLQTFPDDYVFVGKYASVRKQIGMAVPCLLGRCVATAVLNTFAGIPYPIVSSNLSKFN